MNVVSFYRFVDIADPERLREELQVRCAREGLLGTVLLAKEGFNGTLAGSATAINGVFEFIQADLSLNEAISARWTNADLAPFRKLRVKCKNEIVTMGCTNIVPQIATGEHVSAARWNSLLRDPNVLVIDTRNHYEVEVGTFSGSVDPGTDSFREFPDFAQKISEQGTNRAVAMFCTGGIRCEKASALMLALGFEQVYQLQGGILNYLETVADEENCWDGECFVFDSRVAVDRDLAEGGYVQCHACRRPLSCEDLRSPHYREGVSCPQCYAAHNEDRKQRLEERRHQVELAKSRGAQHIGAKSGAAK